MLIATTDDEQLLAYRLLCCAVMSEQAMPPLSMQLHDGDGLIISGLAPWAGQ